MEKTLHFGILPNFIIFTPLNYQKSAPAQVSICFRTLVTLNNDIAIFNLLHTLAQHLGYTWSKQDL